MCEANLDRCIICNNEIGDENWFLLGTGQLGERPRERSELALCAKCAGEKIPEPFRKLVVKLFDEFG